MARFFVCQDSKCDSDHAYCHTCYKEVCEKGEADVHRSIDHEVQPRRKATSRPEGNPQARGYATFHYANCEVTQTENRNSIRTFKATG